MVFSRVFFLSFYPTKNLCNQIDFKEAKRNLAVSVENMDALKKDSTGQSVWSASQSITQSGSQSPTYSKWAATDAL